MKDIQCPKCKVTISVPLKVVELVSDVYTTRLVEILNNKGTFKCQNCVDDASAHAICSTCRLLLCEMCAGSHKRAISTQEHQLTSLDEMRSSSGNASTILFEENIHPAKLLTFYCKREGDLLCEECANGRHASHNPTKIDNALFEDEKKRLKDTLPAIQQCIGEVEKAVTAVKQTRKKAKSKKEENLSKLEKEFQLLQKELNQRKQKLHEQICNDADRRDTELETQERNLVLLLSQLRKCHNFTDNKVQYGVRQDVLAMKVTLLERSNQLGVKREKKPSKPVAQEQTLINFNGVGNIQKLLSQAGTFVSPENCVVRNFSARVSINKENSFKVILRDARNCEVSNNLEQLNVQIQFYNAARHTVTAKVKENSNGCYEISYIPSIIGEHTVSVSIGNQPIPGSPFK